jgi:hypothetical protein
MVLRTGSWTIRNEIHNDARFPGVKEAISCTDVLSTRLQLDPEDARFLKEALDRLPRTEELNRPATLDMNGKAALRARSADQSQITELVLDQTSYSGPAVRANANEGFLKKAVELGFNEMALSDVEARIVCRQPHLVYAWQPLSGDAAIEPTENVIRTADPVLRQLT